MSVVNQAISTRVIDPEVEELVDREWQRQLETAALTGKTYYDSEGYRLNGFDATNESVELRLGPSHTEYTPA